MQLASGHDLSLTFVTETLFSGLDFGVENGAHIGLVGVNGAGKTSLFRLISGELEPTGGELVFARDCRLAYMQQFLAADEDDTLYQAVLPVFDHLLALEQRLSEINGHLLTNASPSLLAEQSRLQESYAEGGGYTYRARLRSTLLGLGFSETDLELPLSALSGGQRSKAALAKVLLAPANLLLLDEPTNHLDVDSIRWLEGYLAAYRGAFLLISHDRYFLDKVCNETWDLHHGRLHRYKGNYSAHLEKRAAEEEIQRRHYANQIKEISRIEGIIEQQRRFNQARNYVTIASKEKQIARLRAELKAPDSAERSLRFDFNVPPPGGNEVLELAGVAKSFGDKHLFHDLDLRVNKGERVFLLGPNGCGKSTLMKIILGRETADQGLVRLGANIKPTYYDQLHGHIRGNDTVLGYFTDAFPRLTQTRIRTLLGVFLFPADQVEKTLDMLSGGEKARLELMKLILEPANFLLLDEPSNHLDISSMEAVERALADYPGSMLVISHDRYLINKLADRVYYLSGDGLISCAGNYDDLQALLDQRSGRAAEKALERPVAAENDYRQRKEEQAAQRKRQKQLDQLEQALTECEQRLAQLEQEMNDPALAADYQRLMELNGEKEAAEADYLRLLEEKEALLSEVRG